ncbi:MAG: hypothetical protein OM95_16470 [Bdellovibrio sp. ArHS]|uniref:HD domain-containing phosphohydrolase n=1 Tax=Bdellovibrio sp. ArHS TaxID=1569284 RepID=UPI000583ECF9|nr:HD domain-containing phosphohydrolase [Bdellovibrio sp. ArHS]KHD87054.1 MAG: hypothetical protein OM95_16470 [Bdellovibrio sp. ArHS]
MSETENTLLFRQRLELLILSDSDDVVNRAKKVVSTHFLTFRQLRFEELPEAISGDLMKAQLVLLAQGPDENLQSFSERVDKILRGFPRSRVVTVMAPSFSRENLEGTQNPRVTPLSQAEFFSTLKFEYVCLYRCRSQYFSIQVGDLFPMTKMTFPAFIRLSLNQRYLAVLYSNTLLTDERCQRLSQAEGLFIQIKDVEGYLQYIATYYDMSGAALKKRARALFLSLCYKSVYLNESLLFDFKMPSEAHLQAVYEDIKKTALELFQIMKSDESLWDIFREALQDDFWELWRAPWVAVYGALISVKSGVGDPMTVLLAALLADVGLYDLEESVTTSYYLSEDKNVSQEQQSSFEKHPLLSLNRCLIKKLPLEESIKTVLVCTHERVDEKGFPNQVPADKLPPEASIVLFAEKIDKAVLTTMRKTGVGFRFLKEKLWEAESTSPGSFSVDFLNKISESLL